MQSAEYYERKIKECEKLIDYYSRIDFPYAQEYADFQERLLEVFKKLLQTAPRSEKPMQPIKETAYNLTYRPGSFNIDPWRC